LDMAELPGYRRARFFESKSKIRLCETQNF
jgi:hypothetical protein